MRKIYCFFLVLLLIIVLICSGCGSNEDFKHINNIKVYYHSFEYGTFYEIKIDLTNRKAYWFRINKNKKIRNELGINQGYQTVTNLNYEKINIFLKRLEEFNIINWNDNYIGNGVDGLEWGIIIDYNISKKIITGSNSFPPEWRSVAKVFYNLTNKEVLLSPKEIQTF